MKNKLEVGQVLWLKVRYQIDVVSTVAHPMLIVKIYDNYIEVIAIDKTMGKYMLLLHNYNFYLNCDNPKETVINQDSYAQLNTKLTIELCDELVDYRRTTDKLSTKKLNELIDAYFEYQEENVIDEARIIYMTKEEIFGLNETQYVKE